MLLESEYMKGTEFSIFLPKANKKMQYKSNSFYISKKFNLNSIIIDDEEIVIKVLNKMLLSIGLKTQKFINPFSGMQYYKENYQDIDLAIIDYSLPEIKGTKIISKFRKINPKIKIILISGFIEDADIQKALKDNSIKYLSKPIKKYDLIKSIESLF